MKIRGPEFLDFRISTKKTNILVIFPRFLNITCLGGRRGREGISGKIYISILK